MRIDFSELAQDPDIAECVAVASAKCEELRSTLEKGYAIEAEIAAAEQRALVIKRRRIIAALAAQGYEIGGNRLVYYWSATPNGFTRAYLSLPYVVANGIDTERHPPTRLALVECFRAAPESRTPEGSRMLATLETALEKA